MIDRSLKARLRGGEICKGTFLLFLVGGDVAQFLAGLGFDYFILDLEHSAFYVGPVRETIRAARAAGIVEAGDRIVITAGTAVNIPGSTNVIKVDVVL